MTDLENLLDRIARIKMNAWKEVTSDTGRTSFRAPYILGYQMALTDLTTIIKEEFMKDSIKNNAHSDL